MSRHEASRTWRGRDVVASLEERGIIVRSTSLRGIAEEAPGAYKDVTAVVQAAHAAGISKIVARVEPLVCIKG
jgi:tRNA-splicing ligase RtcB